MRVLKLKADPKPFEDVVENGKRVEIRFNDRDVNDILELNETEFSAEEMRAGQPLRFTGRIHRVCVTHVQEGYGLQPGHVALSIEEW